MGSNSKNNEGRISDIGDDSIVNSISISILTEIVPFGLPVAAPPKPVGVHLWHGLVGHCPQSHRLLCCGSRKWIISYYYGDL